MSTPWWSTLVAVGTAAWALAVPGDAALVAERSPPTWTIAFVRQMSADGPPYALFRGDLRTGSCRRVRSLGSSYPRPSPDGRHVAFGDPSTRILDTRSGSIIRLSTAPGGWLTWSRDGTALAFVAAGRARVVTTRGVATTDFAPGPGTAWSPDGRRVAFSRTTGDGRAGTLKTVLVIAPVGKPSAGKVVYEEPNPYAYSPYAAWAPDSRTLYHRAGNDVVALDTVTGKRRAGVQNAFVAGTWAPDERSILFTGTGPSGSTMSSS